MKRRQKNSGNSGSIVRVDPSNPNPDLIQAAVKIIRNNGVVVFPTSGLYGIGADAFCAEAVRRVFAIKRRPAHKPVLVLLSGIHDMDKVVRTVPDYAEPLLGLWPGGITFIFKAGDSVPADLTGGTGKIGLRMPAHPVAKALAERFGGPITGTSANLSGRPASASVTDLDPEIHRQVDMVLDAGALAGGSGSTILDVTCWPVKVIREGAVTRQAIDDVLRNG
ncbi:MAG: threonylcarbamoyl-AMP synthase [Desulfosarcina sp.]|nr:threonylcarbamoyl-AMP synthase [Desulfosarcina sp.]